MEPGACWQRYLPTKYGQPVAQPRKAESGGRTQFLSVGIVAKDVDDGKRKDHGLFIEGAMIGSGGVFWNILEKDWRSSPSGRMPAHSVPPRCPVL